MNTRFTIGAAKEVLGEWIAKGHLRRPLEEYSHVGTIWQEVGLSSGHRRVMATFLTEQAANAWLKNQPRYLKAKTHELHEHVGEAP